MVTETTEVGVMSQGILRTAPSSLPSPLPQPPKAGRDSPARGLRRSEAHLGSWFLISGLWTERLSSYFLSHSAVVPWPCRGQRQSCTSGAGTGHQGLSPSLPPVSWFQHKIKLNCCPGSRGWGTEPCLFSSLLFLFSSSSVVPPEIGAPRVTNHPGLPRTRVSNQYMDFHCYDQGVLGKQGWGGHPRPSHAPPPEFSLSYKWPTVPACPVLASVSL